VRGEALGAILSERGVKREGTPQDKNFRKRGGGRRSSKIREY